MIFLKNIETSVVVHVEDGSAEEAAFLAQRTADGRFPLYEQLRPSPELLTGASGAGVYEFGTDIPIDAGENVTTDARITIIGKLAVIEGSFTFTGNNGELTITLPPEVFPAIATSALLCQGVDASAGNANKQVVFYFDGVTINFDFSAGGSFDTGDQIFPANVWTVA